MNKNNQSLKMHYAWKGKIEIKPRVSITSKEDLGLVYTPGVSEACLEINKDVNKSFELTRRWNTVPVITDGTAVLGLGDIGPEAGLPVMEGKSVLFKMFGDIDSYPLCIRSKDVDEIVRTIKLLAGSWGGINLEDISSPRCFEIEKRLQDELDIPVFHDDQHGTAIVVLAALINSLKLVKKDIKDIKIVINGAGAAGISICRFLMKYGAKHVFICDKAGVIYNGKEGLNKAQQEIALLTNINKETGSLADVIKGADVFIGVSGPNCVDEEMIRSMNNLPIVFPLANPIPEINPHLAKKAGAYIVGTGSSQYPNQINNALVFPGLFRGAIDAHAKKITTEMMIAASIGIADCVDAKNLTTKCILPCVLDRNAHRCVAKAVKDAYKNK